MKKTLFGENFEHDEQPTVGIHADPSICRIQFHQYREWVMQPTSQTDGNRLNFEYNDALIDYILNEMRKPGLSDEVVDLKKLGIRKHKNVNFNIVPSVIPNESSTNSCVTSHASGCGEQDRLLKSGDEESEETSSSGYRNTMYINDDLPLPPVRDEDIPPEIPPEMKDEEEDEEIVEETEEDNASNGDDEESITQSKRGRQGTIVGQKGDGNDEIVDKANQRNKSKLTFFDSTLEMSKILVDHIPLEVLKRLVVRWPVDEDDPTVEQDIANRRRLLINVWDCSGDPIQLSVIPLFFSHRCIYLTMYDGTKSLTQPSDSFLSHKLTSLKGTVPTNEEVLEEWIGSMLAQSVNLSTCPASVDTTSPHLPPLIFVTSHGDLDNAKCGSFHQFFIRQSYPFYKSHMIDENPSVLAVSNLYESEVDAYISHHYLRREIDHLARQMPYIDDMIPVQWVRFEQLLFAILEQNKVIILLQDLERYISDMCDISGPLQVQPALAHFANIGSIVHFHRHPALMIFVVIKPQWLMDALASILTSSTNNWITDQVQLSFQNLLSEGFIPINNLLLAYRCSRLSPRYWNETLYFMNYMDLIACHTSLHDSKAVYIPAMVNQSPPGFLYGPTANDPSTLFFSTSTNVFPLSLFNQLVVHCIRGSQYQPTIYHEIVHVRLNSTHHLILRRENERLGVLVQSNTDTFCRNCPPDHPFTEVNLSCEGLSHIIDSEENSFLLWKMDFRPCQTTLGFNDKDCIAHICAKVYLFLLEHLDFLTKCWYPGLMLQCSDESSNILDLKWQTNVLKKGHASNRLAMWFGGV